MSLVVATTVMTGGTFENQAVNSNMATTVAIQTAPTVHQQTSTEKATTKAEQPKTVKTKPKKKKSAKYKSLGKFKLTAYCSCAVCCGKYAYNRPTDKNGKPIVCGASGKRLKQGVSVAADTSVLPFGTEVVINGHKYIVHDVGGAVKGKKIDVYFENHADAVAFGAKYREVKILSKN